MPDLTICDREPITRLGAVQSFGFLIAVTNDWLIARVSANVEDHLGWVPADVLGVQFSALISREAQHDIRNRMAILYSTGSERLYSVDLLGTQQRFDLAIHFQDEYLIIEGEPSQITERVEAASMVRAMAARLAKEEEVVGFHRTAARQVQAITAFDRVMIYRFDQEGHGEVIADCTRSGMESFLGLHFPASDIPRQARELYLRNAFRIVADVDAPAVPILSEAASIVGALDLSMAVTRSVSPVHLEYLRNMGVRASLSISIIVDGELWGLIACHAQSPHLPSFVMRTAAELLGAMYGMMLAGRLKAEALIGETRARVLADRIITAIAAEPELLSDPVWLQDMVGEAIDCDGVAVYRAGHVFRHGATPAPAVVKKLSRRLDATSPSRIAASDRLGDLLPPSDDGDDKIAGMLSIPISRIPRDYIMLFRKEKLTTIQWGGDPSKPAEPDESGRITPRKSFAAFMEEVRGRSLPFSAQEQRAAEAIRLALIEVILRHADSAADERRRASERQDLLIAELNHRVRNILSLIRSIITLSSANSHSVEDYVGSLSGRVQAMARAHDQVTRQNWGPGLLTSLFDNEIAALPGARDRLTVSGPAVMLQPSALSTLALVVHELITNSCKHGALANTGRVEVTISAHEDGAVDIAWREIGGPPVSAPERRGFGSTIIERTIPFDLQGKAEVRFALGGLEADFHVPAQHVVIAPVAAPDAGVGGHVANETASPTDDDLRPLEATSVLLVEDNMLIALEAEDMLRALGADKVAIASSVAGADELLQEQSFHFAMLDINLGQETTFDLASRLAEIEVPFVFASGYGEEVALYAHLPTAIVLQKPYQREHLRNSVLQAGAAVKARRPA